MDPLFDKAKQMFPNASESEINENLAKIRAADPNASDDDIFNQAQIIKKAADEGTLMKSMAIENVKKKYGLGERQALVDQNNQEASSPNWQAGLAALGAGLQGGNAFQAGLAVKNQQEASRNKKLKDFDELAAKEISERDDALAQAKLAKESDPNSVESKMAQDLAISMGMNPEQAKSLTATKFKEFSPALQKKYDIAQRSLDRKDALNLAAMNRADAREARAAEKQLIREEKLAKEAKPSDKQIEAFTDIENAQSDLSNILGQLGKHSNWTGPVDGRIPALLVGEDQNAFRSAVGKYKDAYRKAVTGAGASNAEIARLESRLPSETDTFDTFRAKAAEAQKELNRRKDILASNLEKGGKNVERFKGSSVASAGTVKMLDPKGNVRLVPLEQVEAAKKAGGTLVGEQDDMFAKNGKASANGI